MALTLAEHQSKAGRARMKKLNKKERKALARMAGKASAQARAARKKIEAGTLGPEDYHEGISPIPDQA